MSLHRSVCVYIYKKQRWGDDFQQISQMQNQRYPTNIREGFISNACSNPPNSGMECISFPPYLGKEYLSFFIFSKE